MINTRQTSSLHQSQNPFPSMPKAASRSFLSTCSRQPLLMHQICLPFCSLVFRLPLLSTLHGVQLPGPSGEDTLQPSFTRRAGKARPAPAVLSAPSIHPAQPPPCSQPLLPTAAQPTAASAVPSLAGCNLIMKPGCLQGLLR